MTYASFVGGTAATLLSNDPPSTNLAYPAGISANDLVIVQASWADRTVWGPPPERTYSTDLHGFLFDAAGNFQSTQSLRGITTLGPRLPMAYRPAEDNPVLLGHFISFRLWAFRNSGITQLFVGGNKITDGIQDTLPFTVAGAGGGTASVDTVVIFGLAVSPFGIGDGNAPTPVVPTFTLVGHSGNIIDLVSLIDIGAGQPLGHAAWMGHIPSGSDKTVAYDVRIAGCAGRHIHFNLFLYYIGYQLDPDAPPVGSCPPRQPATPGTNALRVRAHA